MLKMVEESVKESSDYRLDGKIYANFPESLTGSEYTPHEGLTYYKSLLGILGAMKMNLCTNECIVM